MSRGFRGTNVNYLPFDIILKRLEALKSNFELEWIPECRRVVEDDLNGRARRGNFDDGERRKGRLDVLKKGSQGISSTRGANVL